MRSFLSLGFLNDAYESRSSFIVVYVPVCALDSADGLYAVCVHYSALNLGMI